jgi:hypothetical protein
VKLPNPSQPKVEEEQRKAMANHIPRGWTLKRKIRDGVEGWRLSAFPLTTTEVEEIIEKLKSTGQPIRRI